MISKEELNSTNQEREPIIQKKRLPVKLVYFEEYDRIDLAFYREKQIQGWSRKKKEALINGEPQLLSELALAYRDLRNK